MSLSVWLYLGLATSSLHLARAVRDATDEHDTVLEDDEEASIYRTKPLPTRSKQAFFTESANRVVTGSDLPQLRPGDCCYEWTFSDDASATQKDGTRSAAAKCARDCPARYEDPPQAFYDGTPGFSNFWEQVRKQEETNAERTKRYTASAGWCSTNVYNFQCKVQDQYTDSNERRQRIKATYVQRIEELMVQSDAQTAEQRYGPRLRRVLVTPEELRDITIRWASFSRKSGTRTVPVISAVSQQLYAKGIYHGMEIKKLHDEPFSQDRMKTFLEQRSSGELMLLNVDFKANDDVEVLRDGMWYPSRVERTTSSGTYMIEWNGAPVEVTNQEVRARGPLPFRACCKLEAPFTVRQPGGYSIVNADCKDCPTRYEMVGKNGKTAPKKLTQIMEDSDDTCTDAGAKRCMDHDANSDVEPPPLYNGWDGPFFTRHKEYGEIHLRPSPHAHMRKTAIRQWDGHETGLKIG